ncbi:MAG: PIN domain-containing protein [Ilumatobacteraceae bacterium]
MTLVLDSGGVSALAGHRARLAALRDRGAWPPQVPAVVLTESLTGDHRADFHANQLLRMCQVREITEPLARDAAVLRTATGRAGSISATDAIVVAFAATQPTPVVLTSDRHDISALAAHSATAIAVAAV